MTLNIETNKNYTEFSIKKKKQNKRYSIFYLKL